MQPEEWIRQEPAPGSRRVKYRGDTQTFVLELDRPLKGEAWVRTNIGYAEIARREIIREVHLEEKPLARDWFDTPMARIDARVFRATLPLRQVGHFEAKCYFLESGETRPLWPSGPNAAINVQPAHTCCANIIYNAFVRQFGPNKAGNFIPPLPNDQIAGLDNAGYVVIPPSGKFRDLIKELDFIVGELGCRFIQLLPIHPTPTTYGRMGRFGSPYAALSFTEVDPALAEFDPAATPLEQFIELVDAVHALNAGVLIDIAINHTGWAANLHESHPQWLSRDPKGHIEVPGAWGVQWEDLTKLDYRYKDLWRYMAEVFLTWCRRGVDGFRCDAGYMIPLPAWTYIIARVREQFPDTVFLLEGLGGKLSVTRDLLNRAGFNWAYSELFQNYDRGQIETYLGSVCTISDQDGLMVHFSETHDNPRLAGRSNKYARLRTALCALSSYQGAFGFANGVEWYATDKINVHGARSLNWGAAVNQVAHIARLNSLLREHPLFGPQTEVRLIQEGSGNHIVVHRRHIPSGKQLWIAINLDDQNENTAYWRDADSESLQTTRFDLLNEEKLILTQAEARLSVHLKPGQVRCMTDDATEAETIRSAPTRFTHAPDRINQQRYRAKALDVYCAFYGTQDLNPFDPDQAAMQLIENPLDFCRQLNPHSDEPRVIRWQWPRDHKRVVMVPPDHFLLVQADSPFRAAVLENQRTLKTEESLPDADGHLFVLFSPMVANGKHRRRRLKLTLFDGTPARHADSPLLYLARPTELRIKRTYQRPELLRRDFMYLATNGCGAMMRAAVSWGALGSRYDALLAANLSPRYPENRHILLARCRTWLVYQGYSSEIGDDCIKTFSTDSFNKGVWHFEVPSGQGESVYLTVTAEMIRNKNAIALAFHRHGEETSRGGLADHRPVQLILRPDIESRDFHDTTKAYLGPENSWPQGIRAQADGFVFAPSAQVQMSVTLPGSRFVPEPEWHYMIHRALDKARGQDPDSDLFSPGYFSIFLKGNQTVVLSAAVADTAADEGPTPPLSDAIPADQRTPEAVLKRSLDHYVVRRGSLKSVIAGYPWFLDWGRDALIFVRGIIAAGRWQDARCILQQFGQLAQGGTLPNMVQGENAGNRDTSDAPLWFFVACNDLITAEGRPDFLDEIWGERSLRQILCSVGADLAKGTANGIRLDPDSGLLYSPSHFTWMDTNHPAGTPREGYPIEIQALWYAAQKFLAHIEADSKAAHWDLSAQQTQTAIRELYYLDARGYLADCLHAAPGVPAANAQADDALRPNQLFALTLGAVDAPQIARSILAACEELLIPGAIRSLSNRRLDRPLPIVHRGNLVNDPHRPYWGEYSGDEDTRRKPAYHNGTAWTWIFPSYCEAWRKVYGAKARMTALAWLSSGCRLIEQGCIGHMPEILDGDDPHLMRGCDAQAWGASEMLRVWMMLNNE